MKTNKVILFGLFVANIAFNTFAKSPANRNCVKRTTPVVENRTNETPVVPVIDLKQYQDVDEEAALAIALNESIRTANEEVKSRQQTEFNKNIIEQDIQTQKVENNVKTVSAQDKAFADISNLKLENKQIKNRPSKLVKTLVYIGYALPIAYSLAWGIYANQDLIPASVMNWLEKSPEALKIFVNSIFLSNGQIQYGYDFVRDRIKTFLVALSTKSGSFLNTAKIFGNNKYVAAKELGPKFLNSNFYKTIKYNKLDTVKKLAKIIMLKELGSKALNATKRFGLNSFNTAKELSTKTLNATKNMYGKINNWYTSKMFGELFDKNNSILVATKQPVCSNNIMNIFRVPNIQ
ncbi:hypothetical protein KJ644_01445 [Candidatus Dependentiae bacterium]|nr:hypothetical protein [Candidatus Dependentiae bacterium]MBU4387116.1 hypothetical protein [Candidatus Dependentiae bacterium]MCG2756085.1 hypothetical protein [Candidatus Dependentiae bacterium]